jgi:hypothetical protein
MNVNITLFSTQQSISFYITQTNTFHPQIFPSTMAYLVYSELDHNQATNVSLVNDQPEAQFFFLVCLFQSSTCSEQPRAHHQENQFYQYNVWYTYVTLCKWPSSMQVGTCKCYYRNLIEIL